MTAGLIVAVGSGTALFSLVLLFHVEAVRGERVFLRGMRNAFDTLLVLLWRRWVQLSVYLGAGTVRATLHYVAYGLLTKTIAALSHLQQFLVQLQMRNRKSAVTIRAHRKKNHLDEIAMHKEEYALSPEEQRKRKARG